VSTEVGPIRRGLRSSITFGDCVAGGAVRGLPARSWGIGARELWIRHARCGRRRERRPAEAQSPVSTVLTAGARRDSQDSRDWARDSPPPLPPQAPALAGERARRPRRGSLRHLRLAGRPVRRRDPGASPRAEPRASGRAAGGRFVQALEPRGGAASEGWKHGVPRSPPKNSADNSPPAPPNSAAPPLKGGRRRSSAGVLRQLRQLRRKGFPAEFRPLPASGPEDVGQQGAAGAART
jgi:hypothetical protein